MVWVQEVGEVAALCAQDQPAQRATPARMVVAVVEAVAAAEAALEGKR